MPSYPCAGRVPKVDTDAFSHQACLDACLHCYAVCTRMAATDCTERRGEHIEPRHFRLMLACAEICALTADHLLARSDTSVSMRVACAAVCDACVLSCMACGDMHACIAACRECAAMCRRVNVAP
jgi:hypothetical protein